MSRFVKLSMAFMATVALGGGTALSVRAQEVTEITLSPEVLAACEGYGLNGESCACFFAAMIEGGVLEDGDELDVDALIYDYEGDAAACIEANPGE